MCVYGLMHRTQYSDRWILCIVMMIVVPPCGCVAVLCLALAQRSRRNSAGNAATAAWLESISYISLTVAFCFLLAADFYAEQLYFTHLLNLTSSNCSAGDRNNTVLSPAVESLPPQLPMNMDHRLIKQRFVLNDEVSLLQSPIDAEFTVLHRNINVLPVSRYHVDFSFTSNIH